MIAGLVELQGGSRIRVGMDDASTECEMAAWGASDWDERPRRIKVKPDGWPTWSTFTVTLIGEDVLVKREAT